MKQIILRTVNLQPGIRGPELALDVMTVVNPALYNYSVFLAALHSLMDSGEIIRLLYSLPHMSIPKTSYFPQGISFEINIGSDEKSSGV